MPPLTPSKIPEPEDIFSGAGARTGGSAYPTSPETTASIAESPGRGFGRKLVRLLFLSLGAAVIVGAGYFGYHYFLSAPSPTIVNQQPTTNQPAGGDQEPVNVNIPINAPEVNANVNAPEPNTNIQQPINANIPVPIPGSIAPQDDPNSIIDTDGDGLTDYQEAHVYHTDLLRADTDGDGFSDGDEVRNGYNPLGSGKLPPLPITK